jgi:hypothetical protein
MCESAPARLTESAIAHSILRNTRVERDLREIWVEFWGSEPSGERALAASQRGLLNKSVAINAANAEEAALQAERENPGLIALRNAIKAER